MATKATTTEASQDNSTAKCLELPPLNELIMSHSRSESIPTNTASTVDETCKRASRKDLEKIQKASEQLKENEDHGGVQVSSDLTELESLEDDSNGTAGSFPGRTTEIEVIEENSELQDIVTKHKQQIQSEYKDQSTANCDADQNQGSNGSTHKRQHSASNMVDRVPNLCKNVMFEHSSAFKDFKALYDGLDITHKICLLSFSLFPENVIINKRFMIYWWIGEGFIRPPPGSQETAHNWANDISEQSEQTAEELANEVFKQHMVNSFIEPVYEKRSLEVNRCWMHPFVRAMVIMLADRARFFDFDPMGNLTTGFTSLRACLLAGQQLNDSLALDEVHMLFNADATILDFEKPELLSKMRNVNVLCLGRWQTNPKHHIEVKDTKFLDCLKNMKNLRFLSLQGISRITRLPGSISKLSNLTILDLRACHNLESVPDGIGSLQSLTHLDMSGCYLIGNMPKKLSSLSKLEVLKGFVVGNTKCRRSCTLEDLAKLPKLRKLGIDAGVEAEMIDVGKFNTLRKLKIAWILGSQGKSDNRRSKNMGACGFSFPAQLEKLDLQCYPRHGITWTGVSKLNKLYIKGGKLANLGQFEQESFEWKVKILRLKFLNELEMDWRELQELFPKLIYLEKVKCPKLSLFPCDEHGVWMKKTEKSEQL